MYGQPGSLHELPKIGLKYEGLDLKSFQDSLLASADSSSILAMAQNELKAKEDFRYLIYYNSDPQGYAVIQEAGVTSQTYFYVIYQLEMGEDGYVNIREGDVMDKYVLDKLKKRLDSLVP